MLFRKLILLFILFTHLPLFASQLRLQYTWQGDFNTALSSHQEEPTEIDSIVLANNRTFCIFDYSTLSKFSNVTSLEFALQWALIEQIIRPTLIVNAHYQSLETMPAFPLLEKIKFSNLESPWSDAHPERSYQVDYFNIISRYPNLKSIDLSYIPITMFHDFSVISHLEHLEELNLSGTKMFLGSNLHGLETLVTLKKLHLSNSTLYFVDQIDFSFLFTLSQLETLNITGMSVQVSKESRYKEQPFRGFDGVYPSITSLFLDCPKKEVRGLSETFPSLTSLHVLLTDWTDSTWLEHLPPLEELSIEGVMPHLWDRYDMRDFAHLSQLKKLELVGIALSKPYHYEQIERATLSQLEEMSLQNSQVKGFCFSIFAPNITKLRLHGSNVTNGDAAQITLLTHLEELDLGSTMMNGIMVKQLGKLKQLKNLNLSSLDMTKADFSFLESLDSLDLSYTTLSLTAFETLQQLKNLKRLNLSRQTNPNITQQMVEQLREELPACEILQQ